MIKLAIVGGETSDIEVNRLITYYKLAKEFGWQLGEIDKLDTATIANLITIIDEVNKKRAEPADDG